MNNTFLCLLSLTIAFCLVSSTTAQQINVQSPFNTVGSSFNENFGVNFGFSLAGGDPNGTGSRVVGLSPTGQLGQSIGFSQNNNVTPTFGGFDPGSAATFGFARQSSNGSGFSLGFNLSQGSTRTSSTITPSITIPNGGIGTINSGFLSPFVTSVTPVIGTDNGVTRGIASGQLRPYDPVAAERKRIERRSSSSNVGSSYANSSATYGDLSVTEIKARRAAAENANAQEIELALENYKQAAEVEDYRMARINLRKAIKLTSDPAQKKQFRSWMKKLSGK